MQQELNEIAQSLSQLQGEILNATKDKKGYNYSYADLAQILEISRPLMAKHGLSLTQMPTTQTDGKIGLTSLLMHKSGQSIQSFYELPIESGAKMSTAQACGSVITYMRRYATAAILGIAQTDDDSDFQILKKAQATISEEEIRDTIKKIQETENLDDLIELHNNINENLRSKVKTAFSNRKGEIKNAQ
jgi:hypothetical protein